METQICILRHGETNDNQRNVIQGHQPGVLNDKGIEQAKASAARIRNFGFDWVLCSDLKRASDTLKYILPIEGAQFGTTDQLRERGFGVLEGQSRDDYIKAYENSGQHFLDYRAKDGESHRDVFQRISDFWAEMLNKHSGMKILLVTHGAVIRHLLTVAAGESIEEMDKKVIVGNASLSLVVVDTSGKGVVQFVNDTSHLDDSGLTALNMEPI